MRQEVNKIVNVITRLTKKLTVKVAVRSAGAISGYTISACAVFCAAFGWWGVLYPQLTLTEETYQVVSESGEVQEKDSGWESDDNIYVEILNAGGSKVRFRSRLITEISEWISAIRQ